MYVHMYVYEYGMHKGCVLHIIDRIECLCMIYNYIHAFVLEFIGLQRNNTTYSEELDISNLGDEHNPSDPCNLTMAHR